METIWLEISLNYNYSNWGNLRKLKKTLLFGPCNDSVIERKNVTKDLSVLVDNELTYTSQIQKSLAKTRQNWMDINDFQIKGK